MNRRAGEYEQALLRDGRFSLVTTFPGNLDGARRTSALQALMFRKRTP